MHEIRDIRPVNYQRATASGTTPMTTPGTAATNNLAAIMKNSVVFFEPSFKVINSPVPLGASK